jgi:hypothetical protein
MGWRQMPALGALLLSACAVTPPPGDAGAAGGHDTSASASGVTAPVNAAPSTSPSTSPSAAAATALPLLSPASLAQPHQVAQLLRGEYGDNTFNLRCVIRVDAQQLTVVGLTALGFRAFTLKYDGQHLDEERAPQMPAEPAGAGLLNDLQLVYWPLATLQQAWHTVGVDVSEPWPGTRRLKRAGVLLAEVHYAADPWNGRVWLRHFDHPYDLYIESGPLEQGP